MSASYEIIYGTGIPGRAEHLRLVLEEAGASYTDTGNLGKEKCFETVAHYTTNSDYLGEGDNPPYYAQPLLKHGDLIISQTTNILMYLGPKLGLSGLKENDQYRVNALAITAFDGLLEEVHSRHHPICLGLYYEEQKEESLRSSKAWLKNRLPKHLEYWEKVLRSEVRGQGPWLLGNSFTYADIILFQCLDGVMFSYPKAMNQFRESGKYDRVFQLWNDVKSRPRIAAYLASDKRQKYDWGIYRYYEINDVVPE